MANALHFVAKQESLIGSVAGALAADGHLLVVEYDTDVVDRRWVPHPVSLARLRELGATAGFNSFQALGTRPSRYGGRTMYAACLGISAAPSGSRA